MADESEMLYAFNKSDSTELLRVIGKDGTSGADINKANFPSFDIRLGIASGTITARSGAKLGVGTVTMKKFDVTGTVSTLELVKAGTPSSSLTVWNPGSEILSGAYVICFRVGDKWLAVEVC